MRRIFASVGTVLSLMIVFAIARPAVAQQPATKSLYERLGGVYAIATVVDDFIERLLVNETLNANPAIKEARARVPKAGLKFHVTALVCSATGGPCTYTGRSMQESGKWSLTGAAIVITDGSRPWPTVRAKAG